MILGHEDRMNSRSAFLLSALAVVPLLAVTASLGGPADAQRAAGMENATQARASLARAQKEADTARKRAERLAAEASAASEAAERAAREAAALAARIQQAEANTSAAEARLAIVADQRRVLDARLAERQQPIVRLTAALQNMARRPLALSALQPGSLKDTVYVRAVLETAVPDIRRRTASLRGELARGRALEREARTALDNLRASGARLAERKRELAAMETRERLVFETASGSARRENERALVLAEEARDLDGLVSELDAAGKLRRELAALPGPIMRPARPDRSTVVAPTTPSPSPSSTAAPAALQLPVQGRTVTGFGAVGDDGLRSTGIALRPRAGAVVVAPAGGRVAFAGPYRGYGKVVIIEHENGWTSLVTGLGRADVRAGEELVAGSPLGAAPESIDRQSAVTFELRRQGEPVNPLQYME